MRVTLENKQILAAVAPFATWIALQTLLPTTAWAYALRSCATLSVLLASLPIIRGVIQRHHNTNIHLFYHILFGGLGGFLVLALWTLPEFSAFYQTWCVWPLGSPPKISTDPSPYQPEVCGWSLTTAKLIGSAFVIAPVEELFFRSFLYRWLQKKDFGAIPFSTFDPSAFAWTVFLFTLEHNRPLAAALCAVIYGFLSIRLGLLSAVMAHITTNLLLAVYVISWNQWAFW